MKHPSLMGLYLRYEENEVLWIRSQEPTYVMPYNCKILKICKKTLYDCSLVIVMDNDQLGMDQVSIQPLDPRGQCYKTFCL
jgi:hypothetical protein